MKAKATPFAAHSGRLVTTLLLMLLTTATSWAQEISVTYDISYKGLTKRTATISRADNSSLSTSWSAGVGTTLWPAGKSYGVNDEYGITIMPSYDLNASASTSTSYFETDASTRFTVTTTYADYVIESVDITDNNNNSVGSTTGNSKKTITVSVAKGKKIAHVAVTLIPDPAYFEQTGTNEYTIKNTTGWNIFCDLLANNSKGIFTGKTVKLGDDITVTRMAGSSKHDFTGTFDGNNKTLTVNYGSSGNPIAEDYVAPFRNVEGNCTIQNLHVGGTIYSAAQYTSALIGNQWGTTIVTGCTVDATIYTSNKFAAGMVGYSNAAISMTNCVSNVTINSSVEGDGTHGGFVAVQQYRSGANISFEGCVFNGKLLTTNGTNSCGGFVGWGYNNGTAVVTIANSLYAPATIGSGESEAGVSSSSTFVRSSAACSISNCYYTRTLGTAQGKECHSITAGEHVTLASATAATDTYGVSGITAYATGIIYNNVFYAGNGESVSLTLSHSDRTGYTFNGYTATGATLSGSDNNYTLTMGSADVSINASYSLNNYSITYHPNDGNLSTAYNSYTVESATITLDQPTREHYTFAGWYESSDFSGTPVTTIAHGSVGNKEFWAKWSAEDWATQHAGTEADPYMIYNTLQLNLLAARVNVTSASGYSSDGFKGKYFKLGADIAYDPNTANNFTPIGVSSYSFQGTFDGDGHIISGLRISSDTQFTGLFGLLAGTVKNIVLVNPNVVNSYNGHRYVGALVGFASRSTVENCWVYNPTVAVTGSATKSLGAIIGQGFAGINEGRLTNLYFYDDNADHNYVALWLNDNCPVNNVARARKVTLGSNMASVSPAATSMDNGFVYNNDSYYREGIVLTLASTTPPEGYHPIFAANDAAIDGYSYTVGSSDVTLTATFIPAGVVSVVTTFPFEENFNSLTTAYTIPDHWDNSDGTTTDDSYKWCYNTKSSGDGRAANGHEGKCVVFNSYTNSNGNTNFLKTPVMNFPEGKTMQLTFWYRNPAGGDFSVYISTDGGSTYDTALATGLTNQSSWTEQEIILDGYVGTQNVVIVFKGTSNFGSGDAYIYLDDVAIEDASAIRKPSDIEVTDLSATTATIGWTAGGSETAWDLYYSTGSTAPGNDATPTVSATASNPFTISGLTPDTPYYVWVRAHINDSDHSAWAGGICFTTDCEAVTSFPFVQDFNGLTAANTIPSCWKNSDGTTTNNNYKWCYNTKSSGNGSAANGHEGKCVVFNSYDNGNGKTNFLKTPAMNFPTGKTMQLTFWYRNPAGGDFSVYISTDGGSTYDTALATGLTNQSSWTEQEIILDGYVGTQGAVIVFKGTSNCGYNDAYIYLDDVSIMEAPAIRKPTGLTVDKSTITATTATIGWTAGGTETAWDIYYSTADTAPDDDTTPTVSATTTNHFSFTNLIEETTYYVWVRANCGTDGHSAWSQPVTFTTLSTCQEPDGLVVSGVTEHSATITWNAYGLTTFNLRYSSDNGDTWTTVENVSTPYTFQESLSTFTAYQVQVQAICNTSRWSDVLRFRTDYPHITITAENTYTENFETPVVESSYGSIIGQELPDGWDNYTTNTDYDYGRPHIIEAGTSYNYATAGQVLYFFGEGYGYAALPKFTNDLNTLQISFKWATENNSRGSLTLGYITAEDDGTYNTFTAIGESFDANSGDSYQKLKSETVRLNDVPATATRLVFCWYYSSQWGANIDDVEVTLIPCCTLSEATEITVSSAKLTWTVADNTQTTWDVAYKAATDDDFTITTATTHEGFLLDGLKPGTKYTVKVRGNDGSSQESWSNAMTFTTECPSYIVIEPDHPFTEDFEGGFPACWQYIGYVEYNSKWTIYSENGDSFAYSGFFGPTYLVMPDIFIPYYVHDAQLTFWSYNVYANYYGGEYNGKNSVVLLDIGNSETELWSPETVEDGWVKTTIDLSAYADKTITLAFKYEGNDAHGWLINDVAVAVRAITLANDDSNKEKGSKNSDIIKGYNSLTADVTLAGRTLWKDGDWNTLCLPFDVVLEGSVLEDAEVMTLDDTTSDLTDGLLTLNFDSETTMLHAGTPYIIKWTRAEGYVDDDEHNLVNPVFNGVTIDKTMHDAQTEDGKVTFKGSYDYQSFATEDKSILFLGADNTLYWPQAGARIGACRAYFQLNDPQAGVRAFSMNFDSTVTTSVSEKGRVNSEEGLARRPEGESQFATAVGWYSIDGRKLNGKPTSKGMYIHNGRKMLIK